MIHVFAKNQTLVCFGTGPVTIFSAEVALGANDRASSICRVRSLETNSALGAPQFTYTGQLSNDGGQNWVDSTVLTANFMVPGNGQVVAAVPAALLRMRYVLSNPAAASADGSVVCFDHHVDFERA